jgi:hypothetical protein
MAAEDALADVVGLGELGAGLVVGSCPGPLLVQKDDASDHGDHNDRGGGGDSSIHWAWPPRRRDDTALIRSFEFATSRVDQALGSAVTRLVGQPRSDDEIRIGSTGHAIALLAESPRASASSAARRESVA